MGLPMAKRVAGSGYDVTVCGHLRREPVEEMKRLGAREVGSAKEVAQASDVTITMLRDDGDTSQVVSGPNGLMEGAKKGSVIILMSTLSPAFCRKVGEEGKAKGVGVLDAPVTGGSMRAETGELGIMVGGDKKLMERYHGVLETMGRIIYCGALGMGEIVKLANNMALIININGAFEAISWGVKNGADEKVLVELMGIGTASSWVVQNWESIRSTHTEPPSAAAYLLAKDIDYALSIGHEIRHSSPVAALCKETFISGALKLPETQIP